MWGEQIVHVIGIAREPVKNSSNGVELKEADGRVAHAVEEALVDYLFKII